MRVHVRGSKCFSLCVHFKNIYGRYYSPFNAHYVNVQRMVTLGRYDFKSGYKPVKRHVSALFCKFICARGFSHRKGVSTIHEFNNTLNAFHTLLCASGYAVYTNVFFFVFYEPLTYVK
jgi:hypothetical protein